nr:MAG TPA: hypothetical protein [Caudoviricetes sp.]
MLRVLSCLILVTFQSQNFEMGSPDEFWDTL